MFRIHQCKREELDHSISEADKHYIKSGSMNWRKAVEKEKGFRKHECSDTHRHILMSQTQPEVRITTYFQIFVGK